MEQVGQQLMMAVASAALRGSGIWRSGLCLSNFYCGERHASAFILIGYDIQMDG